jgi:putative hydrolase of the HAD superfamily
MQLPGIKNIIFDLGGVIINLDFNKTYDAFASLGEITKNEIIEILKNSKLFDIHGNGDLTDEEFRSEIRKILKKEIPDNKIDNAFNALLLDIPLKRILLLKELAKCYRLFLLSNTNNIHILEVNKILYESCNIPSLNSLFEKIYYSHELKLSKPDKNIYLKVLADNELLPEETVFIDDNADNITGAQAVGIKGILVDETNTIIELFNNAGE